MDLVPKDVLEAIVKHSWKRKREVLESPPRMSVEEQTFFEPFEKQLAERLRSTIEGRDTWRDTAISYRRSEQYHIHKYERVVEQMATLIRFDLSRKAGLVAMERADDGEYVKWKALNELITP